MTKINKVTQFKSCTDNDIKKALLSLSEPLLITCGNDNEMKRHIIDLAVVAWNLSLFQESDESYQEKVEKKIPNSLPDENRKVFSSFVLQIIKQKQSFYDAMKKGISKYNVSFKNDELSITLTSLPINPKHI